MMRVMVMMLALMILMMVTAQAILAEDIARTARLHEFTLVA